MHVAAMARMAAPVAPRKTSAATRSRFEDFIVLKPLGKGSFATVLKVQRKADGHIYALKKVDISKMKRREIADCLSEVRFLASMRHPNIIRYVDSFLDDRSTHLGIVMEFADGGDVATAIERCARTRMQIPEDTVWSYFIQIIDALAYLHRKRILHRDLKAANCFLTVDGHLKLGDLNVSKLARHGLAKTQIGTPYYMSPEIFANRPYDEKSDMWAAGVVLFELCALTPPFKGRDIDDLARNVAACRVPRIPPCYSSDLDAIIRTLLQVNPSKRPAAAALAEDPRIVRRRELLRAHLDNTVKAKLHLEASMDMLDTIAVPHPGAMRRLGEDLPAPQYPGMIPHAPPADFGIGYAAPGSRIGMDPEADADLIGVGVRDPSRKHARATESTEKHSVAGMPLAGNYAKKASEADVAAAYRAGAGREYRAQAEPLVEPVRPVVPVGRRIAPRPMPARGAYISTRVRRDDAPPPPPEDLDLLLNEASRAGGGLTNVGGMSAAASPARGRKPGQAPPIPDSAGGSPASHLPPQARRDGGRVESLSPVSIDAAARGGRGPNANFHAAEAAQPLAHAAGPRVRETPASIAAAARAQISGISGAAPLAPDRRAAYAEHPRGIGALLSKIEEEKAYYASQLSAVSQPVAAVAGLRRGNEPRRLPGLPMPHGERAVTDVPGARPPLMRPVPSAPALVSYARPSWWG